MPNALISSIIVPVNVSGTVTNVTYDIKDAQARSDIETIQQSISSALHWIGVTTTALTDGSPTNPITIGGNSVTASTGDVTQYFETRYDVTVPTTTNPKTEGLYEYDTTTEQYVLTNDETVVEEKVYYAKIDSGIEYVWNGSAWQELGHGNWGSLAFKNSASTSYTPAGTISVTDGEDTTTTVNSITDVGELPVFTVSGETLTFDAGTLPTKGNNTTVVTASGARTASFSGTAATIKVE